MGLINEDKLDDYVFKSASERMDLSVEYMSGWNDAIHHIKANAPTVDAEPVRHGKWIDIDSQMYTWKVRCDQCGHERSMMSTQGRYPKYCEECGAKMDAQEDE